MKLEPGASVTPNVKLVRPLGEGGMGAVWVAEHLALGTQVAVKFLLGDYMNEPAARARFSQEAAAASQVKSSHVVKIYDYGITDTNVPFIVMEMLEGTDLAKRIEHERRLAPADVVTIVSQLCKALERAHEHNVVHRDVKPENVFLASEGGEVFVKLLDFGVAKTDGVKAISTSGRRSTLAGESLGTPYYMSPEQFKSAKSIDSRSDLWSVGVLAYEALTGTLPFVADTLGALAIVVNEAMPQPPSSLEKSLPPAFDAWFAKACARDPNDRFQSARELSSALAAAFGSSHSISAPAFDTGAYRRVVISQMDSNELADVERLSMRDTSFATSGGPAPSPKNHTRTIVLGAVGACAAVTIAFFALRHPTSTHPSTVTSSTAVVDSSRAAPVTDPVPTVTTTSTIASPTLTATESATARAPDKPGIKPVVKPQTSAAPSASAKGQHDRDIW